MTNRQPLFLFVVAFALYCATLSISLDEWDSVQFALGLRDFNILRHQPHPPGYPVYIFMGKIIYFFTRNEVLALTLMSASFGALALVAFYHLTHEMFDKETALSATAVLGVTPLFWLNALKAMTDIPALFFILVSLLFMYKFLARKDVRCLYVAAFLTGIAMGVRLHTALILLPTLVYCWSKVGSKEIVTSTIILVASSLVWLVPLILIHGPRNLLGANVSMFSSRFVKDEVSILGADATPAYLWERFWGFVEYFFLGYGVEAISGFVVLLIALAIAWFKPRLEQSGKHIRTFFAIGIIPYLLVIYVILPPYNPRYLLPALPFICLTLVLCIKRMDKTSMGVGALIVLLFVQAAPPAYTIHTTNTPPVQLIEYINEHYDPQSTVVVLDGGVARHFSYYSTTVATVHARSAEVDKLLDRYETVLTIRTGTNCKKPQQLIEKFSRSRKVHVKTWRTVICRITKQESGS